MRRAEKLSRHTSFRIGGPAAAMVFPRSAAELTRACRILRLHGQAPLLLGNGTNILAPDEGLARIVIKTHNGLAGCRVAEDGVIIAESGLLLSRLAVAARDASLAGMAFAHGIPGTLGGAVVMNAGAYGGELGDVVRRVVYLDENLETHEAAGDELAFSYRHSLFSDRACVILEAELRLEKGNREAIQTEMEALAVKRRESQPLELPSAGSTFKRPKTGYAAALIDEAGLKGYAVGGAQVSEKHAGFVVNRGGAACRDVLRVIEHIQETVLRLFGVALEPEIAILKE